MLGGGRNPVMAAKLQAITGYEIGFLEFAMLNLPLVLVPALATWAICFLAFRPDVKHLPEIGRASCRETVC